MREDLRDGSTRLREPTRAWVTQCALSRICGLCEGGLGRPIAFVGTPQESDRNEFHQPPMHVACAERVRTPDQVVVTTAGFDVVRPDREDPDRAPRFAPNSRL
ncbi:hypothetical protein [Nocardioides sp. Soil805]|uniref:hypothetical protein n=1 Tax=Nocardioides sp. Soil805 TaxID=1736416 RepID=UPI00070348F0|nr:hypothetical protein [Nocardioides sp. Soil805]KRF36886.1 hypothetical protein ASG94_05675 [Nocardioides sp. Soil805]